MKASLLCTSCPFGCQLEVEHNEDTILQVKGNRCKKGLEYAEKEIFDPQRIITTTVSISNAIISLVPVKTDRSIAKQLSFEVIECASKIQLNAPVKMGDVVIKNILETGVNLVATRTLERISTKQDYFHY